MKISGSELSTVSVGVLKVSDENNRIWSRIRIRTIKVVNFDHLATFKIVLKIFPNIFLTIFLHQNDRVLWYFWDPNLNRRFGSQKYHIFFKMLGGRFYP